MNIAERIRQFREFKNLSQCDIEERTGLLRCYVSRVENGHTVPSLETLEKLVRALEMPLYQLFYEESGTQENQAPIPKVPKEKDWASAGPGRRVFTKIRNALSRTSDNDRQLLMAVAQQLSNGRRSGKR
jgi:transcriptional regulator with XRE-family HTH domain